MEKTIEEAARAYADENAWYPGETHYEHDMRDMEESFADAFKAGANYVYKLPLRDRLTDEEREKVMAAYSDAKHKLDWAQSEVLMGAATVSIKMLESIFGAEMFKEE